MFVALMATGYITIFGPSAYAQNNLENASLDRHLLPQASPAAAVRKVRIGQHGDKTRIVIDINRSLSPDANLAHLLFGDQRTVMVEIPNLSWASRFSFSRQGRGNLAQYNFRKSDDGRAYLVLRANRTIAVDRIFQLAAKGRRGHRIVVDLVNAKAKIVAVTQAGAGYNPLLRKVSAPTPTRVPHQTANLDQLSQAGSVPDRGRSALSKLFGNIMGDPGNIELNVRYAKLAEKSGAPRRAMAAYERILGSHPNNEMALAEINRLRQILGLSVEEDGAETNFSLVLGARYEHNAAHRDRLFLPFDSAASSVSFGVRDERDLFGQKFRSTAQVYADFHNRYEIGDLIYTGIDSGPVFELSNNYSIRPAIGVSHARVNKRELFTSASALLNIDNGTEGALLRGVNLSIGYDDFSTRYEGRDGLFVTGSANFSTPGLADGHALGISPNYRYSNTTGDNHSLRNHAYGIKGSYSYPLTDRLTLGPSAGLSYKNYTGNELDEKDERWDVLVEPGVSLTLSDYPFEDTSISVEYGYERNWSNDGDKTYTNHTIGGKVGWLF